MLLQAPFQEFILNEIENVDIDFWYLPEVNLFVDDEANPVIYDLLVYITPIEIALIKEHQGVYIFEKRNDSYTYYSSRGGFRMVSLF